MDHKADVQHRVAHHGAGERVWELAHQVASKEATVASAHDRDPTAFDGTLCH
jgi:hypothetical protein